MFRLKVTHRITLVLVSLSIGTYLVSGILGFLPLNSDEQVIQSRLVECQQLATSCSLHLQQKNKAAVDKQIKSFVETIPDVQAVRIVRFDGYTLAAHGEAPPDWPVVDAERPIINAISIPLTRNGANWVNVETLFRPHEHWWMHGWYRFGMLLVTASIVNGLLFFIFLRKTLSVLDPRSAVPRRVRNTLDSIGGGVVVLDPNGRVMMVNEAFTHSCGHSQEKLIGKRLSILPWELSEGTLAPWEMVFQSMDRQTRTTVALTCADSKRMCFVVNATPIQDGNDKTAGALISFEDITTMEEQRVNLLQAFKELECSKEKIREQNVALQELASRDGLTGALNRRAWFEHLEALFANRNRPGEQVTSVLMDIDHFKKLNDQHGHATGDAVLKDIVRVVGKTIGERGILGRLGGEEFVVALPKTDLQLGLVIAEEIRAAIELELAVPYRVTASVGVSCSTFGAASCHLMVEQSDKALYAAKHGGRNRVRHWTLEIDEMANKKEHQKGILPMAELDEHHISYHAVVSLYAALSYRHSETALHSQRVAEMSISLARGLMSVRDLYELEIAALLHDIGKIGVPDAVLLKPGILNAMEWQKMETHSRIGVEIVDAAFNSQLLSDILRYHHCRWDGKNQDPALPNGDAIPLGARIVALVDAYDAMTADRVYREKMTHDEAIAELNRCSGSQFDPVLVTRFINTLTGWRPDSSYFDTDHLDRQSFNIGHHLERVLHGFESRDVVDVQKRLRTLQNFAETSDMLPIGLIVAELASEIERKAIADWDSLLPLVNDLVEICLTVQRAYLRDVGARFRQLETTGDNDLPAAAELEVNIIACGKGLH